MQQETNIVKVIGVINSDCEFSHEVYGEGFYRFSIEVSRLSEATDILPVTVSERLIDKDTLHNGDIIEIEGQLRSYNNYSDKKNRLILSIFAREIKHLEQNDQETNPNQIFLNGYICKEPIYRTTPFGREIVDMLIAVNRSYNKSDYIPCIAWGRNAKFGGRLPVGANIKIWGRMQSRIYQKKLDDGAFVEKTALEISVSKIEYFEGDESEE